jgi:hypothetical protein
MFEPTRRLLAVPLVRALALECFRIEEEMGAKFLRGVRMGLLAARGTCKLSVWPTLPRKRGKFSRNAEIRFR